MENTNEFLGSLIFLMVLSMGVSYLTELFGYWPIGFLLGGVGFILGWALSKVDEERK